MPAERIGRHGCVDVEEARLTAVALDQMVSGEFGEAAGADTSGGHRHRVWSIRGSSGPRCARY